MQRPGHTGRKALAKKKRVVSNCVVSEGFTMVWNGVVSEGFRGVSDFFARRPIGPCNLVLFVHHRLMRGEKYVHDSRIGAEPFVHCET